MDPRDITPLRGDRDAKLPSYTMSKAEGRVMKASSGSVLFPVVVFWLMWGAGVSLTPGNTGKVAVAAMLTTVEVWLLGPCYNNSRSVEECGFVLQSVPTPLLSLCVPSPLPNRAFPELFSFSHHRIVGHTSCL